MQKPLLLIITPRFPYPVIGGDRLRIYYICKYLSAHFRLTLLSLCETQEEVNSQIPNDGIFERIERIYLARWRSKVSTLIAIPGKKPLQVAYYKSSEFQRRIEQLAPQHDAVFAHLIRTGDAVRHLKIPKFLEMTDAISLNYSRISKGSRQFSDLRSKIYRLESARLDKYERETVDFFDHSFLVSSIDRDYLYSGNVKRLSKVTVASNGVDFSALPYNFTKNFGDLIFIGNITSLQNLDAALYFSHDIFPLIKQKYPNIKLRVIGRIGTAEKATLEKIDGVLVTGEIESISRAAEGGAVGLCPIRLGAGVQNKVLEYMALGLPTVSTPIGLEGFEARNGHELLVANDATSIADAIINLLNDRTFAESIAVAARNYVELHHSWESKLEPMIRQIKAVLSRS